MIKEGHRIEWRRKRYGVRFYISCPGPPRQVYAVDQEAKPGQRKVDLEHTCPICGLLLTFSAVRPYK